MTATALLVTGWCAAMLPTCKAQGVVNDFNERMNRPETMCVNGCATPGVASSEHVSRTLAGGGIECRTVGC